MPQSSIDIDRIIEMIQKATKAANEANERRYTQLVGNGTSGGLIGQMGASAKSRVAQQATRDLAEGNQSLISRGLGNTTIVDSMRRGVREDQNRANLDIDEGVAAARAGVIERREDMQPDFGLIADLVRGAAGSNTAPVRASVPGTLPSTPLNQSLRNKLGGGGGGGGGFSHSSTSGSPGSPSFGSGGGGGGGGGGPTVINPGGGFHNPGAPTISPVMGGSTFFGNGSYVVPGGTTPLTGARSLTDRPAGPPGSENWSAAKWAAEQKKVALAQLYLKERSHPTA